MAYVDLNPIRAGISKNLEDSDYTAIQTRLREVANQETDSEKPCLMPFAEAEHKEQGFPVIPFNLRDYIDLVDWTGRVVRDDKRGYISASIPPILQQLSLSDYQWQALTLDIQRRSIAMLNGLEQLERIEKQSQKLIV